MGLYMVHITVQNRRYVLRLRLVRRSGVMFSLSRTVLVCMRVVVRAIVWGCINVTGKVIKIRKVGTNGHVYVTLIVSFSCFKRRAPFVLTDLAEMTRNVAHGLNIICTSGWHRHPCKSDFNSYWLKIGLTLHGSNYVGVEYIVSHVLWNAQLSCSHGSKRMKRIWSNRFWCNFHDSFSFNSNMSWFLLRLVARSYSLVSSQTSKDYRYLLRICWSIDLAWSLEWGLRCLLGRPIFRLWAPNRIRSSFFRSN